MLIREIGALYTGAATGRPVELPELPVQYADFEQWQTTNPRKDDLIRTEAP